MELEGEQISKREMNLKKISISEVKYSFVNPPGTYTGGAASSFSIEAKGSAPYDMKSQRIFLNTTLGLHKKVDIFIKLGTVETTLPKFPLEIEGDYGFAWGAGVKIKLFEVKGFKIITNAEYMSYKADSKMIVGGEEFSQSVDPGDRRDCSSEITGKEWNVDLLVNKSFKWASPYLGISYSDSKIKNKLEYDYHYKDGSLAESGEWECGFEQDGHIGVLAGVDLEIIPQNLYINLKGRFLNETLTLIGLKYIF